MAQREEPMQIHWTHFSDLSDEEREAIESRLRELDHGHDDLIDIRLVARASGHHRHGGREVRLTCQARGRELVVARERDEIGQALDEVLDDFEREVRRLREKRRDKRFEHRPLPPVLGLVDRIFPGDGYGFVLTDAGEQVYFHRNAVSSGLDFATLEEGTRVGLNIEAGDKGPQATSVVAVPPDTPSP